MSKSDGIITKEEIKMIKNIRDNYPTVWEWMRDKANSNQMSMGKVFHCYGGEIGKRLVSSKN